MSIGHLLDHTCNIYRLTESLGQFRETVNSYALVYEDVPCTFQRRDTVINRDGPGLRATGDRVIYLELGPLLRDRDVVSVFEGPAGFEGPQNLEVESIAVPRGHHIELRCVEFDG